MAVSPWLYGLMNVVQGYQEQEEAKKKQSQDLLEKLLTLRSSMIKDFDVVPPETAREKILSMQQARQLPGIVSALTPERKGFQPVATERGERYVPPGTQVPTGEIEKLLSGVFKAQNVLPGMFGEDTYLRRKPQELSPFQQYTLPGLIESRTAQTESTKSEIAHRKFLEKQAIEEQKIKEQPKLITRKEAIDAAAKKFGFKWPILTTEDKEKAIQEELNLGRQTIGGPNIPSFPISGKVRMQRPDGIKVDVDPKNVEKAKTAGYKVL